MIRLDAVTPLFDKWGFALMKPQTRTCGAAGQLKLKINAWTLLQTFRTDRQTEYEMDASHKSQVTLSGLQQICFSERQLHGGDVSAAASRPPHKHGEQEEEGPRAGACNAWMHRHEKPQRRPV
jgi:hypothetical protein